MVDVTQDKFGSCAALEFEPAGDRRGTVDSVEIAYRRYSAEICKFLRSEYGDGPPQPQDVVHEAFMRLAAYEKSCSVRHARAFLYRTAINIVLDHRRRTLRRERLLTLSQPQNYARSRDDFDPERVLSGRDELQALRNAIQQLPERERTILLLNRLEGVSISEIAGRTGLSPSGVRLIIVRALEQCQRSLAVADKKGS